MQIVFKTSYDQDIDLLSKRGEYLRVGLVIAAMLAAPLVLDVYYLGELSLLLVYVIAGIGLMVLTGFTGQVSFGHAAFLGIGAYSHSILMTTGEYLREEARLTPAAVEFEDFRSRVNELKNDVARAEQRLQRLLDKRNPQ